MSSAIASCADCSDCSAADASDWFRQRRSVSDETPGSLATSAIAFVSDEYEGRDSVNSLTAFALNSSVYLVPLDMIPSSPIELGEMRNKNQAISARYHPVGWRTSKWSRTCLDPAGTRSA